MKKILLSILIISLTSSVYCKSIVYNSNMIGQKLGLFDGSSEYKLKVATDNNLVTTFLYFNDEEIKNTKVFVQDNIKTVTTVEHNNETTTTYSDSLPIKITSKDSITNFTYDNKKLITKSIHKNGILKQFSRYYYSGQTLVALFRSVDDKMVYYIFENGNTPQLLLSSDNKFSIITINNTILTSANYDGENKLSFKDAKLNDDGTIVITTLSGSNTLKEYYDNEGLLIKVETIEENNHLKQLKEISYDEFNNTSKITETIYEKDSSKESVKNISIYNNGKLKEIQKLENGILISLSNYNEFGKKVEILYKNGQKFCTITYSIDGKKIDNVQYEKRN